MALSSSDLIETSGLGLETARRITKEALANADDGELFVESEEGISSGNINIRDTE